MASESDGTLIDTSGSFLIDGVESKFEDTARFIEMIANSAEAKKCFATVYYRKSKGIEGRLPKSIDDRITSVLSFQDIIKTIVADESFIRVEHE